MRSAQELDLSEKSDRGLSYRKNTEVCDIKGQISRHPLARALNFIDQALASRNSFWDRRVSLLFNDLGAETWLDFVNIADEQVAKKLLSFGRNLLFTFTKVVEHKRSNCQASAIASLVEDDLDNLEPDALTVEILMSELVEFFESQNFFRSIKTFKQAEVLTKDSGLVLDTGRRKFYITVTDH